MFARIWQMVIKEYIQVVRNKDSLFLLAVTPVLQLMLLGYGLTYEVRHISTAFLDLDNSAESRAHISRFGASRYFSVSTRPEDYTELTVQVRREEVMMAL